MKSPSGNVWPFLLGWLIGKAQSTSLFKWPWETGYHGRQGPPGSPVLQHGPGIVLPPHAPLPGPPDGIVPASTSTAVQWHEATPAGLPPFPSGWTSGPVNDATVKRAWSLMGTLPIGATKYEQGPGGLWLAYHASHGGDGKKYVTVWHPKGAIAPVST